MSLTGYRPLDAFCAARGITDAAALFAWILALEEQAAKKEPPKEQA